MLITCDLGEGLDYIDALVMPFIDMASIACGGHAGTEKSIARCLRLAKHYNVQIGAHPSYPDTKNFGRVSLAIRYETLKQSIKSQLQLFQDMCSQQSTYLDYIKPHGALYNDMMKKPDIFQCVVEACQEFKHENSVKNFSLVVQAAFSNSADKTPNLTQPTHHTTMPIRYEAFADRRYTDTGTLVSRNQAHALISDLQLVKEQCSLLINGAVITETGKTMPIHADCICMHSDTTNAVEIIRTIKQLIALG